MHWLSLFTLAFAVSLDGLGVGITYGIRKIRFPWWSLSIVTLLAATMILGAMWLGGLIELLLSPAGARMLGAGILIMLGCWAVYNMLAQKEKLTSQPEKASVSVNRSQAAHQHANVPKAAPQPKVFRLELKQLGLVIQILKTPTAADMDQSGSISGGEAVLLGIALSMDAFGAGIGASLMGFPALQTATSISLMSLLFIGIGLKLGHKYAETAIMRRLAFLPGILLIVIGLSKIFT